MRLFGIFIGIDHYEDDRIPTLRYAVNDAKTLYGIFSSSLECEAQIFTEQDATTKSIKQAITAISRKVSEEDAVILYFSGHGAMEEIPSVSGEKVVSTYLVPYDADRDDLETTALSMEIDVARFFDRLQANSVVFFIDSCYSGQAGGRTFPVRGIAYKKILSGFPQLEKISGKGRIIVTSADSTELAIEHESLQHGVFTYYLIDALKGTSDSVKKGYTTFPELFGHLQKHVPGKAKELSGREQNPLYKGEIKKEIRFPLMRGIGYKTLLDFPQAFCPLTVVVGDRREESEHPKSAGDLFAYSASPSDLSWILQLGLPHDTEIVSDKVFVVSDEDYLKERFGNKNLLIIGSPSSNLLSRIVNSTALFRFHVDQDTQKFANETAATIRSIKDRPLELRRFALDPVNQERLRFYMNQFRKGGLLDPTNLRGLRGFVIPPDRDYGVVTLCRNPYAPTDSIEFVSILAAGVHLPGTMQATKFLSDPKFYFRERPFGGVLSVSLLVNQWADRLNKVDPEWSTEPYNTPEGLIEKFSRIKKETSRTAEMTEDVIDGCIDFIRHLEIGSTLRCK